jgi:hypothetical protein
MSEPTYRIVLSHDPHNTALAWNADIYRLSDEEHMTQRWGTTAHEATQAALAWIEQENTPTEPDRVLFASGDGELVTTRAIANRIGDDVAAARPPEAA